MDLQSCEVLVAALEDAARVVGQVQARRDRAAERVAGSLQGPLVGHFGAAAADESELVARLARSLRDEAEGWRAAAEREAALVLEHRDRVDPPDLRLGGVQ